MSEIMGSIAYAIGWLAGPLAIAAVVGIVWLLVRWLGSRRTQEDEKWWAER